MAPFDFNVSLMLVCISTVVQAVIAAQNFEYPVFGEYVFIGEYVFNSCLLWATVATLSDNFHLAVCSSTRRYTNTQQLDFAC